MVTSLVPRSRWPPEFITNTWVGTPIVDDVVVDASVDTALLTVVALPPPQPLAASAATAPATATPPRTRTGTAGDPTGTMAERFGLGGELDPEELLDALDALGGLPVEDRRHANRLPPRAVVTQHGEHHAT